MSDSKQIWVPDEEKVFVQAQLVEESDPAKVRMNDGSIKEIALKQIDKVNPAQFDRANDIAELTYLNEASVLNNLSTRYANNEIYTYSGLFLVAVNPYKSLPIYGDKAVPEFRNKSREDCSPHIYAVADLAFRQMLETRENQSILITGESGAGKTENTKRAIQYLSSISSGTKDTSATPIDAKILQANPVLEAFGNAQTVRNHNSSRFGKFIRVEFTPAGEICGASIEWYLLEKSRVITQASEERNYHIFYQLLKGASPLLKERLLIPTDAKPSDFNYLSKSTPTIEGVNDTTEYNELITAFKTMGMSRSDIDNVMELVALVLHLGNIEVKPENSEQGRITNMGQLDKVAKLLGVTSKDLSQALLRPKVKTGKEWITHSKSAAQVKSTIDALAKTIYERLFGHIVDQLNLVLRNTENYGDRSSFIGVLDIAGFEIFKENSFEQLCINYTNEKLQQFFNHHMFVLEQEEYVKEKIQWDYIDFGADLQPTIDLIEKANPMGIFSCLDEDCVMPKATDKSFTDKLAERWTNKNPKFRPSRLTQGFTISHYASPVEYGTEGWLEKNRDPVSAPISELLSTSSNSLVKNMFPAAQENQDQPRLRRGIFRTVAQKFKEQLVNLMGQLELTHPHFVRCILPNQNKKAGIFENRLVLEQLRCNGVLEGIRIARSGFPNRLDFKEFRQRYQALSPSSQLLDSNDGQRACTMILKSLNLEPSSYKVGLTKVFFRNGVLAELEEHRDQLIAELMSMFQVVAKAHLVRKRVKEQMFKKRAAESIANSIKSWGELKSDPWWNLMAAMRPLLTSKESLEANRRDMRMQKLEETVRSLKEEQHSLRSSKQQLLDEVDSLKQAKEGAEMLAADKEEILKRTQARVEELETENTKLEADIAKIESQLDELLDEREKLTQQTNNLRAELKKGAEIIEQLQNERIDPDVHKSTLAKLTAAETQHKDLKLQHDEALSKISSLTEKHAAIQTEKSSFKEKMAAILEQKEKAETSVKSIQQELSDAKTQRSVIEKEHKLKLAQLSTAEETSNTLKEKIESLQKEIALIPVLKRELQTVKKSQDDSDRKHAEKTTSLEAEIEQLKAANTQIGTLKKQLSDASSMKSDAESKLKATEERLDIASTKLGSLSKASERATGLEKELESTRDEMSRLQSLNALNESMSKELAKLKEEHVAKDEQIANHKKDLRSLEKDLTSSKAGAVLSMQMQGELDSTKTELSNLRLHYASAQSTNEQNVRRIQDLERALASATAKITKFESADPEHADADLNDVHVLRRRLDKVQREKGALADENSRLLFQLKSNQYHSMEHDIEKAKSSEVKKLHSEIKILKLKLVQSEKALRASGMHSDRQPTAPELAQLAVLRMENSDLRLDKSTLEKRIVDLSKRALEVPKQRSGGALRDISGNDRQVSMSKSDRTLHNKVATVEEGEYSAAYVSELELSLEEEIAHKKELTDTLEQFTKRAEEYHTRLDTAEVVLKATKQAEERAQKELASFKAKYTESIRSSEKELASSNETISLLRKELTDREADLLEAKRKISRPTSMAGERRSISNELLASQVHGMKMRLDDLTNERDRLLADKIKLEKRLSNVWTQTEATTSSDKELVELQDKLEAAMRERLIQTNEVHDLKSLVEQKNKQMNQLKNSLQETEQKLEEQQQALDKWTTEESEHQIALRRAQREIVSIKEGSLRTEKELEQYKLRYERAALQRGMSRKADKPAFL